MVNYLFPIQIENGEVTLLAHVAAEIPDEMTFACGDDAPDVPNEIEPVLEKLHPNEEFDNFLDAMDALNPTIGILVHKLYSKPHSVIGYHEALSEQEAREIIQEIEDRLGYELEKTDDLDPLSSDEIESHLPKTAGWNKSGDFVA